MGPPRRWRSRKWKRRSCSAHSVIRGESASGGSKRFQKVSGVIWQELHDTSFRNLFDRSIESNVPSSRHPPSISQPRLGNQGATVAPALDYGIPEPVVEHLYVIDDDDLHMGS